MMSKLIKIHSRTKQRLDEISTKNDTYDDIINRMLDILYPIKNNTWNQIIVTTNENNGEL